MSQGETNKTCQQQYISILTIQTDLMYICQNYVQAEDNTKTDRGRQRRYSSSKGGTTWSKSNRKLYRCMRSPSTSFAFIQWNSVSLPVTKLALSDGHMHAYFLCQTFLSTHSSTSSSFLSHLAKLSQSPLRLLSLFLLSV